MAGWGPGKDEGDTGRVSDTRGQDNTTHTETRQRRNEEMPWDDDRAGRWGGVGRTREAPAAPPLAPSHGWQEGSGRRTCPLVRLLPPSWIHPVFSLLSRLGGGPCPVGCRGRRAETTPPHNQPWRAANYRMLGPGPSLALPPLQPARAVNSKPRSLFLWRLRVG